MVSNPKDTLISTSIQKIDDVAEADVAVSDVVKDWKILRITSDFNIIIKSDDDVDTNMVPNLQLQLQLQLQY